MHPNFKDVKVWKCPVISAMVTLAQIKLIMQLKICFVLENVINMTSNLVC